ncbi:MAG: TetR/AcrR family transcriptional regulator [Clostridiales bacterium]|nr:TetR/AcrR family transcriptional regulator [Clostridiales bacterium]
MSVPDRSIDPRILESAREEFLDKGFEKASLKTICEKAGVTTGALYKRFAGKEELFCEVVSKTAQELEKVAVEKGEVDVKTLTDEELIRAWDMDENYMLWWFHYINERRDGFVLLLCCANGTRYANFQHEWVERLTEYTYVYYEEAYRRGLTKKVVRKSEMHIMLTAFWTTLYEPFIHGFSWEEVENFNQYVCGLFNWYKVLGFEE